MRAISILCAVGLLGLSISVQAAENAQGKTNKGRRATASVNEDSAELTPAERAWVDQARREFKKDRNAPAAPAGLAAKMQDQVNGPSVEDLQALDRAASELTSEQVRILRSIAEKMARGAE